MTALAFLRGGKPRKRVPAAESRPSPGQIHEDGRAAAGTVTTPATPGPPIVTRAESAPCTCPEHCERDHEHD